MLAKPKQACIMILDGGDGVFISLHPKQYWEATFFSDNEKKVGLVRGNLHLIVDKNMFKEKFELLEHKKYMEIFGKEL